MAVERHVLLSRPHKNGKNLFSQLEQVEKATGRWPEEYKPIPPPEEAEFVWQVFWELRNSSKSGFCGPEKLSFIELDAWQRVRDYKLTNLVIDMILRMDEAYISEWHKKK